MGGRDDLHAAIAVQVCCHRRWQHVCRFQQGLIMVEMVVPAYVIPSKPTDCKTWEVKVYVITNDP